MASGSGTDLQSIIDACESGQIPGKIAVVISNNSDAFALERGKKYDAETLFINHRGKTREQHEHEISDALEARNIDLIVLAGWLRIFTYYFSEKYKNKMINIHPALLPKYGGKGMHGMNVHEAVIAAGEKESGCSVHFVTEGVDEGPIIAWYKIPVLPEDTAETLQVKVLETEHILLPLVVQWFAEGKINLATWQPIVANP